MAISEVGATGESRPLTQVPTLGMPLGGVPVCTAGRIPSLLDEPSTGHRHSTGPVVVPVVGLSDPGLVTADLSQSGPNLRKASEGYGGSSLARMFAFPRRWPGRC